DIRSKTTVCANRFGTAVRLADFQASAYGPAGVFGSATVQHARSVRACPGRGDATYVFDMRATKFVSLGSTDRKVGLFAEFFHLFNTANFCGSYTGNARSATFRQPTGFIPGIGYPRQA